MRYFLIAGETSGDMHGAYLIRMLKQADAKAQFAFWGGDQMQQEYPGLLKHYSSFSVMGFVEVLLRIFSIINLFKECKKQIDAFNPDVVVLIDYPGFNLRMAAYCKSKGYKVVYYIAPKIWAWKENRGKKLEKYVDELLVIFPFEQSYFKKWRVKTTYVGNPLLNEIESFRKSHTDNILQSTKPIIALLPGSRKQEIERMLPIMTNVAERFKDYQFIIAGVSNIPKSYYEMSDEGNIRVIYNDTYKLLHQATAAIVCSGTATLETAFFEVPQVCCYKANAVSIAIARLLVKIKFISLVNINLEKQAITELIQEACTIDNIVDELNKVLPNGKNNTQLMNDYKLLKEIFRATAHLPSAAERIINSI
jgi:lipid-A-disaccharide synthase